MSVLPDPTTPEPPLPAPGPRRLRLLPLLPLALGGLVLGGGLLLDQLLASLYRHWRPQLEQQIGGVMGRPLQLGSYEGLGLDGLRLGPGRFLPGPHDRSQLRFRQLRLGLDPLASWRAGQPMLDLGVAGAELRLAPNARGQWWVFGAAQPGQQAPRLALQLRLLDPAQLQLQGPFGPRTSSHWQLSGGARLLLRQQQLALRLQASPVGAQGQLAVAGLLHWQQLRWQGEGRVQGLQLAALQPLLPATWARLSPTAGVLNARLQLNLIARPLVGVQPHCQGQAALSGLRWSTKATGGQPLTLPALALNCQGSRLTLPPTAWTLGPWRGTLAGQAEASGRLQLALTGRQGRSTPGTAQLQARWSAQGLAIRALEARLGRSQLRLRGQLQPRLALEGPWQLVAADLDPAQRWAPWLGNAPLQGQLQLTGPLTAPRIALQAHQAPQSLLGPWQLALHWQSGLLALEQFRSSHLLAQGVIPLQWQPRRGLQLGDLRAQLQLLDFPLQRLNPLLGAKLQGRIRGGGSLQGSLQRLRPNLALVINGPGVGPLQVQEQWQGSLQAQAVNAFRGGRAPAGAVMQLQASTPQAPGRLQVRFDSGWQPVLISLQRGPGSLVLQGRPKAYRWEAQQLTLLGLALQTGPNRPFRAVQGAFSGSGQLQLQPLAFDGRWRVQEPSFLGLNGRQLEGSMAYRDRGYRLQARWDPLASGPLQVSLQGRWQGALRADLQARRLSLITLRDLAAAWPLWQGARPGPLGRAAALGALEIDTRTGSLEDQLQALAEARRRLLAAAGVQDPDGNPDQTLPSSDARRLNQLQGSIDADLKLAGANLERLQADLQAQGHLWLSEQDQDQALATTPFRVTLQGPLRSGDGQFSLTGLPLALIALLTPVPDDLRGQLTAKGQYRLGQRSPALNLELALQDAALADTPLRLERGKVTLAARGLALDLALRSAGASSSVDLAGLVPLDPRRQDLELRLASRGDGLRFLTAPLGGALDWQRGSADLQLLVRGSLREPIANGFLRLRDGECQLVGQAVRQLEATVLFDFEQLVVQSFTARVGSKGQVRAEGRLGLLRPGPQDNLAINLAAVPVTLPRLSAQADGQLQVGGSLAAPALAGELRVSHGTINAQPGNLVPVVATSASSKAPAPSTSVNRLLETRWNFREPLVLQSSGMDNPAGEALLDAVPRLSWLGFDGLKLRLGPDLRVVIARVANFQTGGLLRLQGRLDPSLRATGVVRLLGGRLNLFTTTFSLDPDAPNVAVFAPSLGLIPYLDIALRTRVADNLQVVAPSGIPNSNATFSREAEAVQGVGSNRFNLVQVTVAVSGPADRIAENLRLRSNPPLPQERLVALIGGNALAGLSGGAAGTALATVLGQTLLSPLLSGLSDAFGQRLSLALYPTYLNQVIKDPEQLRSGQVPPRLVLGSEIGLDLSDRFNASVLAAPNQADVPPQITLRYKASNALSVEGAVDTQGSWQTQLQMFFRF